jgi:hypothetical protein
VQVIETAYRRLEEGIVEAVCLDDVIKVHDTYLNEIFLRALQSEQHENLNTQVCCAFLPDLLDPLSPVCSLTRSTTSSKQSFASAISRRLSYQVRQLHHPPDLDAIP